MVDFVNHPPHYTAYKGLEIIDLTEQMNFNRGNAVKYVARAGLKGEGLMQEIQDLEKAVWYIQREIKRISWDYVEEEPTCDICDVMERDADGWCGNCGNCVEHCQKHEGCVCKVGIQERDIPRFCPHYKNPRIEHLQDNCQRSQARMEYDLERFDTGDAHFIARRNVHLTMDEVIDEVRKMLDVGCKIGGFAVSTYEVYKEIE